MYLYSLGRHLLVDIEQPADIFGIGDLEQSNAGNLAVGRHRDEF